MKPLLAITLLSWLAHGAALPAQDNTNKAPLERDVTAELVRANEDKPFHAAVDLGNLPAGSQIVVNLLLKNSSDQDIRFSGVSKRCSCSQFKPERNLIPGHDATKAKLNLRIPGRNKTVAGVNTVTLVDQDRIVANIDLEFRLEGLLAFKELMDKVVFESDETSRTLQVPFLATLPIQAEQVQVRASDNLAGVRFEITATDEGGVLNVFVPADLLVNGDMRGEIYLGHPEIAQPDCMWLMVKDARKSEISPRTILFRRAENGLIAKAIIRTASIKAAGETGEIPSGPPVISCTHDGKPLELKVKKLGASVYSVECLPDAALAENILESRINPTSDANVLHWEISSGNHHSKLTTPFVVEAD